jgi:predicted metal-dependent hydrolase
MDDKPARPRLDAGTIRALRKGVEEFNAGKFFECHDTLEDVWHGIRGPARNFFQGLIQVSVGFYHLGNGNRTGAASQLEKALSRLSSYGASYAGIELETLQREVQLWLARIRSGEKFYCTIADLPKLNFTANQWVIEHNG